MEQMQHDDNGGLKQLLFRNIFLQVNNFRHTDIRALCSLVNSLVDPFLFLQIYLITYELNLYNYSVSPFFTYAFIPYIYETGLNVNICRTSNLTLDVLYKGSGYELFSQSALCIAL